MTQQDENLVVQLTRHQEVSELLQIMFISELLTPTVSPIWLVCQRINNYMLFDNRAGGFGAINPEWSGRVVRLNEVMINLMLSGKKINIVTTSESLDDPFFQLLEDNAVEAGVSQHLDTKFKNHLHIEGILTNHGILSGSISLAFQGITINGDSVYYDSNPEIINQMRQNFQEYHE